MYMKGSSKPRESSHQPALATKNVEDMSEAERRACDVGSFALKDATVTEYCNNQDKEFSGPPPDNLSNAQKSRWNEMVTGKLPKSTS